MSSRTKELRDTIVDHMESGTDGSTPEEPNLWGTILVAPYPRLPAIGDLQGWEGGDNPTASQARMSTGTPGLDEMLGGVSGYWARPVGTILAEPGLRLPGRLYQGSTTLLLGRSGTGKTICCLQFLLAHETAEECLYVNFENRPHRVIEWFPGDEQGKAKLRRCKVLYRRRSHLDLNLLVSEINHLFRTQPIERVAIDGLSDLLAVLDHRDYSRLVEDLLVSIRSAYRANREKQRGAAAGGERDAATAKDDRHVTIFITLEADASPAVLSRLDADSFADNVLVLRQLTLNDEQRKTIQVVKARGNAPDLLVRELVVLEKDRYPLRSVPGLENYRHLSEGTPEPVRVTLQLIEENEAERLFNERLMRHLRRLFGYRVSRFGFARDEITRTLLDIASGVGRIPYSDIKLLNIDEWWVRELRLPGRLEPGKYLVEQRHPLLPLNAFLSRGRVPLAGTPPAGGDGFAGEALPSDFWIMEMEKASVPLLTDPRPVSPDAAGALEPDARVSWQLGAEVVALPSYLDFGLFCVHKPLARAIGLEPSAAGSGACPAWLDAVPLRWVRPEVQRFARAPTRRGARDPGGPVVRATPAGRGARDAGGPHGEAPRRVHRLRRPDRLRLRHGDHGDDGLHVPRALLGLRSVGGLPHRGRVPLRGARRRPAGRLLRDAPRGRGAAVPRLPRPRRADAAADVAGRRPVRPVLAALAQQPERRRPRDAPEPAAAGRAGRGQVPGRQAGAARLPAGPRRGPPGAVGGDDPPPDPLLPRRVRRQAVRREAVPARIEAFVDALRRFERLLARVYAAVDYRTGLWARSRSDGRNWPTGVIASAWTWAGLGTGGGRADGGGPGRNPRVPGSTSKSLRQKARESALFQVGRGVVRDGAPSEEWSTRWRPVFPHSEVEGPGERRWLRLPAALFMDLRDLLLLLDWHDFRINLLAADQPLSGVVQTLARRFSGAEPVASATDGTAAVGAPSLTGYACEGSWLVAVDRTTRSPNLAAKFLTEMTSSARAEERGEAGAGIPARKDFFDFHGHEPCRASRPARCRGTCSSASPGRAPPPRADVLPADPRLRLVHRHPAAGPPYPGGGRRAPREVPGVGPGQAGCDRRGRTRGRPVGRGDLPVRPVGDGPGRPGGSSPG